MGFRQSTFSCNWTNIDSCGYDVVEAMLERERHRRFGRTASSTADTTFYLRRTSRSTMNNDESSSQKFAIHAACREGQTKVVESLLNAEGSGRRLITREDEDGRQPIHWASSYNRLQIVEYLAEQKGFDIDAQDGAGWTALMMAASLKEGDALVDFLLLTGASVDVKTNNGQTALHYASSKSNLDTVKKLIAHEASARVKDRRGQLPLHRAAAVGNVPIVKVLLENRSPINATDVDGSTALHHAIAEGHGDAAVVLLKAGVEIDKRDGNGALAIDLAPDAKIRSYIERAAEAEDISLNV
nr:ankyrin repeat-containing protein c6c3.08 [Quercus suber]